MHVLMCVGKYAKLSGASLAQIMHSYHTHLGWNDRVQLIWLRYVHRCMIHSLLLLDCMMTSSHERRYLGLQLLLKVVPNLTADQVSIVSVCHVTMFYNYMLSTC